jgi:hypothetical protein
MASGGVTPSRVWVPSYIKSDGTLVAGYWRDNTATRRLPGLKQAMTFRSSTFSRPKR